MTTIRRIHAAQHHATHEASRAAQDIASAAKGTFPTVIDDQKLSAQVEKMRPHVETHETAKGGNVQLVYRFKSPADAKAVYEQATELDAKSGKRYPSPSLGDNIAECLDRADEVGDPKLALRGSVVVLTVDFKPA